MRHLILTAAITTMVIIAALVFGPDASHSQTGDEPMGQYGTATGIVRYSDPVTGEGSLLILKEGELLAQMTGDFLRLGAASGEHVYIDADEVAIMEGTATLLRLHGSTIVIGNVSGQHVYIDADEVSIKNGSNAIITLSAVGSMIMNPTAGGSIIIGSGWAALPTGANTVALGVEAGDGASGTDLIAIGTQAGQGSSGTYGIALGNTAGESNSGNYGLFGGYSAGNGNSGLKAIFLGHESGKSNSGDLALGMGYRAAYENDADRVIAIGAEAGSSSATLSYGAFDDTILLGHDAVATAANQMVVGSVTQTLSDIYVGRGVRSGAGYGNPITIHATGALLLDDTEGHDLVLAGGTSTGSAAGGSVYIQTAPAGSSGNSENGLVDRLRVTSDGLTQIGDAGTTNYAQFDETGNLTFAGSAQPWDDIRVEPVARTTGTNAPSFEKWYDDSGGTSRGVYLYSFDDASAGSEKEIFFTMQMPHTWNGGDVHLHVHWVGAVADTTATPRWGLEYAFKEPGAVFGDTVIVYATGNEQGDTDITAHKHYITEFAAITPGSTADGLSSILIGRLFRNSSNAADTYNATGAKCGLLYIDAHYQIARIGSTDEYTP